MSIPSPDSIERLLHWLRTRLQNDPSTTWRDFVREIVREITPEIVDAVRAEVRAASRPKRGRRANKARIDNDLHLCSEWDGFAGITLHEEDKIDDDGHKERRSKRTKVEFFRVMKNITDLHELQVAERNLDRALRARDRHRKRPDDSLLCERWDKFSDEGDRDDDEYKREFFRRKEKISDLQGIEVAVMNLNKLLRARQRSDAGKRKK